MRKTLTKQCDTCARPLIIAPRAIGRGYVALDPEALMIGQDRLVVVGTFAWDLIPLVNAAARILGASTVAAAARIHRWPAHARHVCEVQA